MRDYVVCVYTEKENNMKEKIDNMKIVTVRMDEQLWKKLRKIAFVNEIPMAAVVRRGLELFLKEKEKEGKK